MKLENILIFKKMTQIVLSKFGKQIQKSMWWSIQPCWFTCLLCREPTNNTSTIVNLWIGLAYFDCILKPMSSYYIVYVLICKTNSRNLRSFGTQWLKVASNWGLVSREVWDMIISMNASCHNFSASWQDFYQTFLK